MAPGSGVEENFSQYTGAVDRLPIAMSSNGGGDDDVGEESLKELQARFERARARKEKACRERYENAVKMRKGTVLRHDLNLRINALERKYRDMVEDKKGLEKDNEAVALQLEKNMQINAMNDAFYIWYSGPYGTINTFRLGNVPAKPIEWSEINTALGDAALALSVVVGKIPKGLFQLTKYGVYPLGSYSKVYKIERNALFSPWSAGGESSPTGTATASTGAVTSTDKPLAQAQELVLGSRSIGANPYDISPNTTLLNLYIDLHATFSLFPRSKFNAALNGLMCVIHELGAYISVHDPPLCLPYKIDIGDGSGRSCTISPTNPANQDQAAELDLFWSGNTSAGAYNDHDEQWTRALKFALTDIKWIVAWSTKHYA